MKKKRLNYRATTSYLKNSRQKSPPAGRSSGQRGGLYEEKTYARTG
jgi:hypothetical protein